MIGGQTERKTNKKKFYGQHLIDNSQFLHCFLICFLIVCPTTEVSSYKNIIKISGTGSCAMRMSNFEVLQLQFRNFFLAIPQLIRWSATLWNCDLILWITTFNNFYVQQKHISFSQRLLKRNVQDHFYDNTT
jgi:hypothetical protein